MLQKLSCSNINISKKCIKFLPWFNFFSSRWYNFRHLLENTGTLHLQVMIAKYFQIIIDNWRCTHIFLLSLYCYNSCMSQFFLLVLWLHVYHICHLFMLHQWSEWCLLILDIFSSIIWYLSLLHDQCTFSLTRLAFLLFHQIWLHL